MNIKPLFQETCSLGKIIFRNLAFNLDKMIKVNISSWNWWESRKGSKGISILVKFHLLMSSCDLKNEVKVTKNLISS